MAAPTIEFSTDVTTADFNAAFDGTYQELVDDNHFHLVGRPEPDRNKIKAKIYQNYLDSGLCIKGIVDGNLFGITTGEQIGNIYQSNILLYCPINGSKAHLYDANIMIPYEEAQRDFLASLGITQISSDVLRPCSSYTYHYVDKPTRHLVNIISDTLKDTRYDGKEYATIVFEYI